MKFIGIILLLLTSIFLIACSAKENLSTLNDKYGGIYIFDKKFYDEIEKREAERKELRKNTKGKDLGGGLYAANTKIVDEKIPQILSNGKRYYVNKRQYEVDFKKTPKAPESYKERIKNVIGRENLDKIPGIGLGIFYTDNNGNITPITMYIQYSEKNKKYGLFGDEGRGFSLSRDQFEYYKVKNKFYMQDLEK